MPLKEPLWKPTLPAPETAPDKVGNVFGRFVSGAFARSRQHKTALLYTSSSLFVSLCAMVSGILMVRWIPPADIGLWQSVRLAVTYSMFAMAGITNGLSRELPYFMGRSDGEASRRLASTALLYLLGAGGLALLGGAGTLLVFHSLGNKVLFAIAAVTASIIFTFYTNYLIVTFRSSKSFADLSKVKLVEGCCGLATIPLLFYLGYNGMLLRVMLVAGIVLLVMHRLRPMRVSPAWNGEAFLILLKTGIPIFALDYLASSASTCDRLVLLRYGGVKAVGLYAMALLAKEALDIVPKSLGEYIYPRMSHSLGQLHDPKLLWKMAVKSSVLIVGIMIPIAVIGWFLMPPVVAKLFPKYTEAVTAARVLLIAEVFYGATLGRMAIWSLKSWKLMTWYQILAAGFCAVGPVVGGLLCASPLKGVSLGVLSESVIWCPIAWCFIYLATHRAGAAEKADQPRSTPKGD